jgi:ATP synthase F1 delta subunit
LIQKKEASRYAKALLRNVGFDEAPQAISEISLINAIMTKSREFRILLVNPRFTAEERESVIKQIAEQYKLSEFTVKFINYLSDVRAVMLLPDIIRIATNLYFEKKQKAKATIMTPVEISAELEKKLKESLKKVTDKELEIEYVMDPSLLGGVLIKIGSTMYDTSIRGQLRLLKDELIKG